MTRPVLTLGLKITAPPCFMLCVFGCMAGGPRRSIYAGSFGGFRSELFVLLEEKANPKLLFKRACVGMP